MATVKSYRALRTLKVTPVDVRQFGDFVPEALEYSENSQQHLIRSGVLEVVWVDDSAIEVWRKERSDALASIQTVTDVSVADEDSDPEDGGGVAVATKKRVIRPKTKEKANDGITERTV